MVKKLGKSESVWLSEMLDLNDKELTKKLRDAKVSGRFSQAMAIATGSPAVPTRLIDVKAIRKDEKQARRATTGEKGLGALGAIVAGLRGGGSNGRNHQNIPLRDRVHPTEYRRILDREARKQGLL